MIVKADGLDYSAINRVALIDGLLVLFDIRTGRFHNRGRKISGRQTRRSLTRGINIHPSCIGLKYALSEKNLKRITAPIQEYSMEKYHKKECGYVLFIPSYKSLQGSSVMEEFERNNMILQFLPEDRGGISARIEKICRMYKLNHKQYALNSK